MKRQLLLITSLISGLSAFAQPTMTQSNEPAIGDFETMFTCATTTDPQASVSGSAVTWDFSQLVGLNGQTKVIELVDPTTTPAASYYPTSTKAFNIQGSLTNFFNSTVNQRVSQGFVFEEPSFGTVLAVFSTNEQQTVQYPFANGDSFSDNFSGTLAFDFNGAPQNPTCTGNAYMQIDGQGTLNLPQATSIPNVIRYKTVDTVFTQVVFVIPLDVEIIRTQYEYYDYASGNLPVFIHTNVKIQQAGATAPLADQTVVLSSIEPTNFAGLEEIVEGKVTVYPNPTSDVIIIKNISERAKIELVDAVGNKLKEITATNSQVIMDVDGLSDGNYFIRIVTDQTIETKPVIIR
jgi:hypothetical protein